MARTRIVLAKVGLDAHERGVHVVAYGLREAGFEVIYLGLRRTAEQVVSAAIQEDADVIGLSSLAGAHGPYTRKVLALLKDVEAPPLVVLGGLIPEAEQAELLEAGVTAIFSLEASVSQIAEEIEKAAETRRQTQHA
jgi:methylmalonyl-CoA mutase C-terminal domain/subunit